MTNASHAMAAFESLTQHSTPTRRLTVGHQLKALADECHPAFRQKYLDRANECFTLLGYARVD